MNTYHWQFLYEFLPKPAEHSSHIFGEDAAGQALFHLIVPAKGLLLLL